MVRRAAILSAIALFAVAAVSAPAALHAQSVERAPAVRIGLNPPVGEDLELSISDDRLMRGGERVVFRSRSTLRFEPGDDGWDISLRLDALDCEGAPAPCAAFRQVLAPSLGVTRRFSLSGTLAVGIGDDGPLTDGSTMVGSHVLLAVAAIDADAGPVGAAELREALRFCDSERPDSSIDEGLVLVRESEGVAGADGAQVAVRETLSRVDPASGLTLDAQTLIRAADGTGAPVSRRQWRIARVAGGVIRHSN